MTQETVAFWSGHANSSAMCLRMKEIGNSPDLIVHATTGLEFPEVYTFMDKFEKLIDLPIVRENVLLTKPQYNFDIFFNKPFCRGKFVGSIHGFPMMAGRCWHRDNVKRPVYKKYESIARETYTGMTKDEVHRTDTNPKHRWPLIEYGWSAIDSLNYLRLRGIPHKIYDLGFKRLGCIFCPNQSKKQLFVVYKNYPEIWDRLLEYESRSPKPMRGSNTGNKNLFELQYEFEREIAKENKGR